MSANTLPSHHWIHPETTLEGERVRLLPLRYEHLENLVEMGSDPRIWENFPVDRTDSSAHFRLLCHHLVEMQRGNQHSFAVEMKNTGKLAGLTRLFNLDRLNRSLEVGSWLAPDFWKTGINSESKFLLLEFCFEKLKAVRVQFRTDVNNLRSRAALEKMGATLEGTFRNERIRSDGSTRDAIFYSILDREWAAVRAGFLARMERFVAKTSSVELADFRFF